MSVEVAYLPGRLPAYYFQIPGPSYKVDDMELLKTANKSVWACRVIFVTVTWLHPGMYNSSAANMPCATQTSFRAVSAYMFTLTGVYRISS